MLSNAPNSSENHDANIRISTGERGNNRRYSLFSSLTSTPLSSLFSNINSEIASNLQDTIKMTDSSDISSPSSRRQHYNDQEDMDEELQASRKVINLLQRQLELLRVEKQSLESLLIESRVSNSSSKDRQDKIDQTHDDFTSSNSSAISNSGMISDSIPSQKVTIKENNISGDQDQRRSHEDITKVLKSSDFSDIQNSFLKIIQSHIYKRDEEIVELKFSLNRTMSESEQLKSKINLLLKDNEKLKVDNSVLKENLSLRDQTIVSLSHEVFEQDNLNQMNATHRRQSNVETLGSTGNISSSFSATRAQRHITKLIDTLDAYKKTNELLITNITNLTDRCNRAEKKEMETRSQCHELEAKCCQIQSKLLSLLKEIESSSKQQLASNQDDPNKEGSADVSDKNQEVIYSESVKLLIQRILEDKSLDIPTSWKEANKKDSQYDKKYECDELGFYIKPDTEKSGNDNASQKTSGFSLRKRASLFVDKSNRTTASSYPMAPVEEVAEEAVEQPRKLDFRRSTLHCIDSVKKDESRWHLRWDNFIKDFDKIDLRTNDEFKALLRSGVPQEYRCKVWKSLIEIRIGKEREIYGKDYYQNLLEPNRSQSCAKKAMNPSYKQIELDLLRTLPNNKHFETLDSSGTVRLRRVLNAYSEHNPQVGYCQGINRLAAVALLVLPEEEAFWCLATIIDNIMPNKYYNDLWLAQVDSHVVMDFVTIKLPNLSAHFEKEGIELSLFAWFLTIFVDGTPPVLFLRLWDCFLYEGDKILFRVALALLKVYENDLLKINNSIYVNNFLRSSVNSPMDIDEFFDIAFHWINPLRSKSLAARRKHNLQLLRSSFEKVGRSNILDVGDEDPSQTSNNDRDDDDDNEEPTLNGSNVINI